MSSGTSWALCDNCGKGPFKKSHLLPDPAQTNQLRDILRAHTLPLETAGFRNVIGESPYELARYDSEIQRLQEKLDQLKSDRATLESYANGCRSLFLPVRRLPAELLVEIFEMCAPPGAYDVCEKTTPMEELERLAKKYLLQLAQVCSRWYGVVVGTTRLWSAIIIDTTVWGEIPLSPPALVDLIASSLERSGGHPLVVECIVSSQHSPEPVLELLAQHCKRWRRVFFWNDLPSLKALAAVKGNLPLLEDLSINNQNNQWTETGIFAVAPRLTKVLFVGQAGQIPTLPWGQIRGFACHHRGSDNLVDALALIPLFSTNTRCGIELNISNIRLPIDLPPITSNVTALFLLFIASPDQEILGAVLGSLTLPCLQELALHGHENGSPLFWHQHHFLTFASRSALHASLTVFEIQAIIQDDELLQCLSVLPSLKKLIVWDCQDQSHAVITDNLLRRLVWRPDHTCLIPSLTWLSFASILRFSDDALWQFVTSRIVPGRDGDMPFQMQIYWTPRRERECSPEIIAQLEELEERGDLMLTIEPDPSSE
ncbi:hypothetical protein C8R44DRAFT_864690 [Mycena epipterygia]|nr:hypothetical protein C8R44DRAFT_864690 [Mycena epipterygia]